jgi:hypothetical protein
MKNIIHGNKKWYILAIFIAVFTLLPLFAKAETYATLDATCYPNTMTASTGETVTWRASAFGGNNDYYITWRGTNGLSGYGSNLDTEYNTSGVKSASITVTSGGQSITKNCNSVQIYGSDINNNSNTNYNYNNSNYNNYDYYNNNNYNYNNYDYNNYNYNNYNNYNIPLTVSCSVNTPFAPVGTRVSWTALPSGGNGNYSFSWSGNDSVYGYNRTLDIFYNSPGIKNATVTVRSGNQSISRVCSNSITIGAPINPYYNNQYQNTYPTYNPPVVTTPVVTVPKTIIKYVEVPVKKTTTEVTKKATEKKTNSQVASLSTYADVPWGWVAVMVIVVLLFMIMYLVFNSKKI